MIGTGILGTVAFYAWLQAQIKTQVQSPDTAQYLTEQPVFLKAVEDSLVANHRADLTGPPGKSGLEGVEQQIGKWTPMKPNFQYTAKEPGLVVAVLTANDTYRTPEATGVVDGETLAETGAVHLAIASISKTSFTMPVSQGSTWEVKVVPTDAKIDVRWFQLLPGLEK